MINSQIIATTFFVVMLVAACASVPTPGRDRFGLVAVDVPENWEDVTRAWLIQNERMGPVHRSGVDYGIRFLVKLASRDKTAECRLREFRYLPSEVGYHYSLERLAYEVVAFRDRMLKANNTSALLTEGYSVVPSITNPSRAERVQSREVNINRYSGWKMVTNYWFGEGENARLAVLTVSVISRPSLMRQDSAKYYVVAECDTEGRRQTVMDRQLEIDKTISSLRMGQDIGGVR